MVASPTVWRCRSCSVEVTSKDSSQARPRAAVRGQHRVPVKKPNKKSLEETLRGCCRRGCAAENGQDPTGSWVLLLVEAVRWKREHAVVLLRTREGLLDLLLHALTCKKKKNQVEEVSDEQGEEAELGSRRRAAERNGMYVAELTTRSRRGCVMSLSGHRTLLLDVFGHAAHRLLSAVLRALREQRAGRKQQRYETTKRKRVNLSH